MSESPQETLVRLEREFGAAVHELGEFEARMPAATGSEESQDRLSADLQEDFRSRVERQEEHSRLRLRVERLREELDRAMAGAPQEQR